VKFSEKSNVSSFPFTANNSHHAVEHDANYDIGVRSDQTGNASSERRPLPAAMMNTWPPETGNIILWSARSVATHGVHGH